MYLCTPLIYNNMMDIVLYYIILYYILPFMLCVLSLGVFEWNMLARPHSQVLISRSNCAVEEWLHVSGMTTLFPRIHWIGSAWIPGDGVLWQGDWKISPFLDKNTNLMSLSSNYVEPSKEHNRCLEVSFNVLCALATLLLFYGITTPLLPSYSTTFHRVAVEY